MTRRYAVSIHKGGVGKTTTTVNLAGALAEAGGRVLLVDCDSQSDLSGVFLDNHESLPHSLADLFAESGVLTRDLIQPTAFENISIIPADRRLELVEKTADFHDSPAATTLADAISEVEHDYDFVILDCATRPHLSGYAALVAAHRVLVPLIGSQYSFRSVASIRRETERVRASLNPDLTVHYYFSMLKRSKMNELYRSTLVEVVGEEAVLKTQIPDQQTIQTAANLRKPLVFHSKRSKAADAIRSLANELIGADNAQKKRTNKAAA